MERRLGLEEPNDPCEELSTDAARKKYKYVWPREGDGDGRGNENSISTGCLLYRGPIAIKT